MFRPPSARAAFLGWGPLGYFLTTGPTKPPLEPSWSSTWALGCPLGAVLGHLGRSDRSRPLPKEGWKRIRFNPPTPTGLVGFNAELYSRLRRTCQVWNADAEPCIQLAGLSQQTPLSILLVGVGLPRLRPQAPARPSGLNPNNHQARWRALNKAQPLWLLLSATAGELSPSRARQRAPNGFIPCGSGAAAIKEDDES